MSVREWYFGAGVKRLAESMDAFETVDVFIEPEKDDGPFVEKKRNKHKVVPLIPPGSPNRIQYGRDDYRRLCMDKISEGFVKRIATDPQYSEWQVMSPLQNSDEFVVTGVAYTKNLQHGPIVNRNPFGIFVRVPNSIPFGPFGSKGKKYLIEKQFELMEIYAKFDRVLYIELLCSPVEKNGASDALFHYIETFYSHKYDAIILKSVRDPRTLACYDRNGFIDVCELGGPDDDGLHFMYKPLRAQPLTIKERKSYEL